MATSNVANGLRGLTPKLAATALAMAMLAGCEERRLVLNSECSAQGLVLVLPGIDGRGPLNEGLCRALAEKDLPMAVELYDWTVPFGGLLNQVAMERNRREAAKVATKVTAYRRAHPTQPVWLVGHSGGTAIAIWAVEVLAEDRPVDGIILLASSLSPEYDLSAALRRCRVGIASFYSPHDVALLGAGTTLVGTMDGRHTESAGKIGFRPQGASQAWGRLEQIPYRPEMAKLGYDGGHFSCLAPGFASACIRPLLATANWAADGLGEGEVNAGSRNLAVATGE